MGDSIGFINYSWKLQYKIESFFKINIKKFGKRFIINLFLFSILIYGLFGFIWIQYVDGIPHGFVNVLDFVLHGRLEIPIANPFYPVFISIASIIVLMKNEDYRFYCLFFLLFSFFLLFFIF